MKNHLFKYLLLAFSFILLADPNSAFAQVNDSLPDSVAIFTLLDPATQDLGQVKAGEYYYFNWRFRNDGNIPLKLTNVKSSCGCVSVQWPKNSVLPGDTAMITATFDGGARMGPNNKSVTILGNFPEDRVIVFLKLTLVNEPTEFELEFPKNGED